MAIIDFDITAVLDGTDDLALTGITDMTVSDDLLYTVSASGSLTAYRVTATGLTEVDAASLPTSGIAGIAPELQSVTLDGATTLLATGAGSGGLWSVDSAADGTLSGAVALPGGLPADLATCTTVVRGGVTYLVGARVGSERPGLWTMNADGSFSEALAAGAGISHGAGITAMQGLDIGGKAFVVAAAADSNEMILFKVEETNLTRKATLGAEDGLGVATPSSLAVVQMDGATYAIMGASGSSSLSVALVAGNSLTLTDHIIDDRDTRFQNVTTLETITADGRVFIVAAGSDDGLSLFELMQGGSLLHHAALADSTAMTLGNVSDIALTLDGATLQIAVASASEPGLTLLSVDLPAAETLIQGGNSGETLTGTAAGDVLADGAGQDTLRGGAGADVFVLSADNETDTIVDFELGTDSLDLSAWAFLRSAGQLTVVEQPGGAEIWFCDERLIIETASGETLTAEQVGALDILSVDRILPAWSEVVTDPEPDAVEADDSGTGTGKADYIECGMGNSTFEGKGGEDTLRGNAGDDSLYGGASSDVIEGGDGSDYINAGQGLDTIMAGNGDDDVEGKDGHDWIEGDAGNDTLSGDNGRDVLLGGSGNDSIWGGKGYDILDGGAGDDYLKGGEGYDELYGGDGDDWIGGGVSNDTMFGDGGNDELLANQGADLMDGGAGNDSMRGHDGHDTMYGGDGDDIVDGDSGRDVLDGGAGNDTLTGDKGADTFVFNGGHDVITDFTPFDMLKVDRDVWAGTRGELLDTAVITGDGLLLDLGPAHSLLFQDFTDLDTISDVFGFA